MLFSGDSLASWTLTKYLVLISSIIHHFLICPSDHFVTPSSSCPALLQLNLNLLHHRILRRHTRIRSLFISRLFLIVSAVLHLPGLIVLWSTLGSTYAIRRQRFEFPWVLQAETHHSAHLIGAFLAHHRCTTGALLAFLACSSDLDCTTFCSSVDLEPPKHQTPAFSLVSLLQSAFTSSLDTLSVSLHLHPSFTTARDRRQRQLVGFE